MAHDSEATVIFLDSHPVWLAAQRRARERDEAMGRHPSCRGRGRTAVSGGANVASGVHPLSGYSSTDTPA